MPGRWLTITATARVPSSKAIINDNLLDLENVVLKPTFIVPLLSIH